MIEYIYFVKCPNCEDEHFYFFNDAKECAMSQLSKKPIITQTEVNRNDFGECTDSCDLGTVWSWEDMMSEDEPVGSVFTKDDLKGMNCCGKSYRDTEFDNLDNSVDFDIDEIPNNSGYNELTESSVNKFVIVGEKEDYRKQFYNIESEKWVTKSDDATLFDDHNSAIEVLYDLDKSDFYTTRVMIKLVPAEESVSDTFRKSIPDGMTVEQLVEEMEENEDTVECKWCDELFDKSECRYEVDLGWLCDRCQAAIKSRGETLTFREGSLDESFNPNDYVEFEYDNLHVTLYGPKRDVDDWDELEDVVSYTMSKKKSDVFETILDLYITEEDVNELEGGLEALDNTKVRNEFFAKHFDDLFEKYYDKLLAHYREAAIEEYEDSHTLSESLDSRDQVELEYPSLTVTLYGAKRDVDDWDEVEHTTSHVFLVPKVEVATVIWENWITEEDVVDVEGGLDTLEDDTAWEKFLETHFDDLFEKYHQQILDHFKDEAAEDFRERSQEEYDLERWAGSSKIYSWNEDGSWDAVEESASQKTFLEEFDDAETHKASLTDCPECGTVSYDMKEQYCTNCGLNL